ncbi:MAG TPA: response regulator [Bacteroidales bacterium]|nr:response regulator [Bacteroidales bacterium]
MNDSGVNKKWPAVHRSVYYAAIMLAFFYFQTGILQAQVPFTPTISEPLNESWRWRHIEALSAKGIRCMTDDQQGNMWFGLDAGIMRYDGYNWKHYNNTPFLNQPVTSLFKSHNGTLWAGGEAGLLVYNQGEWEKVFPQSAEENIPVTAIAETPDGTILAGTQDGLVAIKGNRITLFTTLQKAEIFNQQQNSYEIYLLPDEILFNRNFGRVDEMFVEKNNLVWVFMSRNNEGKLLQFNLNDTIDDVLRRFKISYDLGGHHLPNRNQFLQTRTGERWIINGFYKSGLLRFRNNRWENIRLSNFFGGDELHTDIIELSDGSIWVGGLEKIFVYREGSWRMFSAPAAPVPSSRIIFHQAADGYIWVAGMQGDVFRLSYDQSNWVKYYGLNFQFQGRDKREWFLSVDGQVVYQEHGSFYAFDAGHGLIDAPVRLIETSGGRVWAAGSHRGVAATAYLENGRWFRQLHPGLSWGIDPRSVFIDRNGSMWFGASVDRQEALGQQSGVLQLLNPDEKQLKWKHHTQREGIVQHNVYGIGQSPDGSMWLGGTRLLNQQDSLWQQLEDFELLNEYVDIVHSRQLLWVGSRFYGVFRFDGKEWKQFTSADGLPGNTVISIYEERPDKVWAITDRDIAVFDGQRWFAGQFTNDFRIPREGGEILVDPDGSLWINKSLREWKRRAFPFSVTTAKAMQEFWTIRYRGDRHPPKTQIIVYTDRVNQPGNTLIGWTATDFWKETPTDQLTFSYRINQGEWSEFSNQTSLMLTNMRTGRHLIEVRARDMDFNIETQPASISFVVVPPIYRQAWFIILVAIFISIIVYLEIRLLNRNARLNSVNQSLNQANQALEVRQKEIALQNQTISEQKNDLEKKALMLEEKHAEILIQRDHLKEMVEKVEDLSNVKQRFFTNISHEFRTPLTLILGSIERLLAINGHIEKKRLNQAFEIIQRNSKRILRLINQILEVSKIETGKLKLNPEPGDIASFTQEIAELFNDLANIRNIDLKFESHVMCREVLFDRDKIEKVLFNLLGNAFKSTPALGNITVRVEQKFSGLNRYNEPLPYEPNQERSSESIAFSVSDTGKGIHQSHIHRIFERFYQVDEQGGENQFDSSGIGLSYVKDLVAIHNGHISVESQPGLGSSFVFEIPLVRVNQEALMAGRPEHYRHSNMVSEDIRREINNMTQNTWYHDEDESEPAGRNSISVSRTEKPILLVVEDEVEIRDLLRDLLETDFEILEARNGLSGYRKAENHQPDLIISDVMMPEMDGKELCKKLKSNLATNHIPVILLTARILPEHKLEGYQTGADAYIEKPYSAEYLKMRIKNLLEARETTRKKVIRDLITQPSEIEDHSEDGKMLRKIQEVLEENVSTSDFDVESMSQLFFLSRSHFSRKIKQITGLTPKEIIDSYRLKRAGQLLQQRIPVAEVAYMVGFDHPNSFARAFRKFYNMTPTEFSSQN